MGSIVQDRLSYRIIRSVALIIQLGALVCLTPIKQYGGYPERVAGFVALSLIAWFLNLCSRHTAEYQRRTLTKRVRAHRRQEFLTSILAAVFAVASIVYLQMAPTWPIFAISLSLGGCAGYALTNA
ncbi:MAG TPA: hypothetical protein VJ728_16680 [Candidatus Binataceae bacterium]|nr:hypothetical protein [Candidatus Binataceae bacterium]